MDFKVTLMNYQKNVKDYFLSLLLCICDLLVCSHASFSAKVSDLEVTLV